MLTVNEASESTLTDNGDSACYACYVDQDGPICDGMMDLSKEMEESAVDSGVATNHSVHSELSQALSNSIHQFPDELTPSFLEMQAELSKLMDVRYFFS